MDTQTVLGQHGAPFQIEWEGKKYTLSFRTQKLKAEIERWAKQRAVRELVTYKNILPPDDYKSRMDKLLAQFDNPDDPTDLDEFGQQLGGYAFNGTRVQNLLITDEGAMALLRAAINDAKIDEGDLTCLFIEKRDEIEAFFKASHSTMAAIKADLGDDSDPKALMRALKKVDMW